jgi:aerobic-type carbon monoxide dehydrogenase small subunit (CoxS/CutS family)
VRETPQPATVDHHRWVTVEVNGEHETRRVDARLTLADFLRRELGLTGTHLGCEHGSCGACTVIVNGDAVRSCLTLAVQADGARVETVESLAPDGRMDALQTAFREHHALQCGFCTSGFLMSLTARRREGPIGDEAQAREALSGNICRCTGYAGMVDALLSLPDVDGPDVDGPDVDGPDVDGEVRP